MVLVQLYLGIDGPVDMKLTFGIIAVEGKDSLGKEDKVSNLLTQLIRFCLLISFYFAHKS